MHIDFETVGKFAWPFLKAVLILVIGHYIIKALVKVPKHFLEKTRLDISLINILVKILDFAGHVVIILSAMTALGISTTGLLAAVSAVVVSLALALKDSLSNIASGFLLLAIPRFVTGDYIEIDGEEGFVDSINLFQTTIRTYDNRHITYSNRMILDSKVTNYTWEGKRRLNFKFPIPYEADIEFVKKLALEAIEANPLILPDEEGKKTVRVGGYGDSSVELWVLVWIKCDDYWPVYYDTLENVRARLKENGIDIPFNQLDVHFDK